MRLFLLGVAASLAAACAASSPQPQGSASPSSPSLTFQINAGDCSAASDDFALQALDMDRRGFHEVATFEGTAVMLSPGVVPCPFTITFPSVRMERLVWLVDRTRGVAWGPWSRIGLASRDWRTTVDLVDTD